MGRPAFFVRLFCDWMRLITFVIRINNRLFIMYKPSIPKGMRDFSPAEMAKRNYIFNTIKSVYHRYGFLQIETPTMENLST